MVTDDVIYLVAAAMGLVEVAESPDDKVAVGQKLADRLNWVNQQWTTAWNKANPEKRQQFIASASQTVQALRVLTARVCCIGCPGMGDAATCAGCGGMWGCLPRTGNGDPVE
jgi:hypothetical protein